MKVPEALEVIRRVGVVESSEGKLKLKFPERERTALQPAIDALRRGKTEALALLAEPLKDSNLGHGLEDSLKGLVIELWSDAAGCLFIVGNEDDRRRLCEPSGTVYTASELRRVVQVGDPAIVREIHEWKRVFDGHVREVQKRHSDRGQGNGGGELTVKV